MHAAHMSIPASSTCDAQAGRKSQASYANSNDRLTQDTICCPAALVCSLHLNSSTAQQLPTKQTATNRTPRQNAPTQSQHTARNPAAHPTYQQQAASRFGLVHKPTAPMSTDRPSTSSSTVLNRKAHAAHAVLQDVARCSRSAPRHPEALLVQQLHQAHPMQAPHEPLQEEIGPAHPHVCQHTLQRSF